MMFTNDETEAPFGVLVFFLPVFSLLLLEPEALELGLEATLLPNIIPVKSVIAACPFFGSISWNS